MSFNIFDGNSTNLAQPEFFLLISMKKSSFICFIESFGLLIFWEINSVDLFEET